MLNYLTFYTPKNTTSTYKIQNIILVFDNLVSPININYKIGIIINWVNKASEENLDEIIAKYIS